MLFVVAHARTCLQNVCLPRHSCQHPSWAHPRDDLPACDVHLPAHVSTVRAVHAETAQGSRRARQGPGRRRAPASGRGRAGGADTELFQQARDSALPAWRLLLPAWPAGMPPDGRSRRRRKAPHPSRNPRPPAAPSRPLPPAWFLGEGSVCFVLPSAAAAEPVPPLGISRAALGGKRRIRIRVPAAATRPLPPVRPRGGGRRWLRRWLHLSR